MDRTLNVQGLPELSGDLSVASLRRLEELKQIELKIDGEYILRVLAEREMQLHMVLNQLRDLGVR